MTHKHSSPIVVQAFAAPFARYPGYVINATRSRDQHVIVIVLTRPASTDSRLVRKLAHAQHHAAPPKRRQNNVKNVTGRKIGVDRPWLYHRLKTQTDNASDGYEISFAPCTVQWQHNRVTLFIATYLRHNTKLTLFVTSKASSARTKH